MYFDFYKFIESKLYKTFINVPKRSNISALVKISAQCHDKQLEVVGNRYRYTLKSGNQIKLTLFGRK